MKFIRVFIATFFILALLMPAVMSAAGPPAKVTEIDNPGWNKVRLDQYTVAESKGTKVVDGQLVQEWEVTFSALPETLSDLETKTTVEWRGGMSDDGVPYWETGNNVYFARVTGTRVSVEYEGILAAWDPTIYLGGTKLGLTSGPKKVTDPYSDSGLGANTIEWIYEKPGGAFSESFRVLRYVRQIGGKLQEFYILEENPGQTLRIVNGYEEELGFAWLGDVYAYDSNGLLLLVGGDAHEKVVDFRELSRPELEYPIIIDPSFFSGYNDFYLYNSGLSYATTRTASSGELGSGTTTRVGQFYDYAGAYPGFDYEIWRAPLYFSTGGLPDEAIVTSAYIKLYGVTDGSDTNFYITVQNGYSHPSLPPIGGGEYNYAYYSGNGGQLSTYGFSTSGYNNLYLNEDGRGWINTEGYTNLMLRSSRDIDNTAPTQWEIVYYRSENYGSGEPELVVSYYEPVTKPDISTWSAQNIGGTSAELKGYLSNDGGADCNVWFEYGITTSYGTPTQPDYGRETGYSWDKTVYDLSYGTLYHYTAKAQNSADESEDEDVTFLTKPNKPTNFVVTPGDGQNALTWSMGTGSDYTMIRRSTSSYPTSPTSGTQVYFDAGTSETDGGLSNGQTYYYSAWGYTSSGGHTQYSATYETKSGIPYVNEGPTTTTYAANPVGTTTATLKGYLNYLGGDTDADVYFQYYWGAGSWVDNEVAAVESPLDHIGSFSKDVSGLPADTEIHVRTYAVNDYGTGYGDDVPFTTGESYAPSITTIESVVLSGTSVTLYGFVDDDGGYPGAVTVDFEWGSSNLYGKDTGDGEGYSTDDDFHVTLTEADGLDPDTTYYFRARGWNAACPEGLPSTGVEMNFTTSAPSVPDVDTLSATDVGATTALLRGQLTDDGGVNCEVRFTWSTNATLSVATNSSEWQADKTLVDPSFNHYASNLTYDTTYYFRAEAKNGGGQTNSTTILDFTTVFSAPEDFIVTPLTSTSISLIWTPQSDKTEIWVKVGSYPSDRLDGSQAYFGPGTSTTYEDLNPGTTYFFRAWSWRDGDNYSEFYAEDAATTLSPGGTVDVETPYDSMNTTRPEAPTSWWQGPGSSKIQNWPLVSYIDSIADGMGMDRGSMWAIFAGLAAVLVGLVGAMLIPLRFAGFTAGLIGCLVLVGAGVLVGWILAFYVIVGIALIVLLPAGEGG